MCFALLLHISISRRWWCVHLLDKIASPRRHFASAPNVSQGDTLRQNTTAPPCWRHFTAKKKTHARFHKPHEPGAHRQGMQTRNAGRVQQVSVVTVTQHCQSRVNYGAPRRVNYCHLPKFPVGEVVWGGEEGQMRMLNACAHCFHVTTTSFSDKGSRRFARELRCKCMCPHKQKQMYDARLAERHRNGKKGCCGSGSPYIIIKTTKKHPPNTSPQARCSGITCRQLCAYTRA